MSDSANPQVRQRTTNFGAVQVVLPGQGHDANTKAPAEIAKVIEDLARHAGM